MQQRKPKKSRIPIMFKRFEVSSELSNSHVLEDGENLQKKKTEDRMFYFWRLYFVLETPLGNKLIQQVQSIFPVQLCASTHARTRAHTNTRESLSHLKLN